TTEDRSNVPDQNGMRTAPAKAASVRCVRQACRHWLWAAEETARQNWNTAEGPYQDITDLYIRSRVSQADATIAPTTSWVRQCHSSRASYSAITCIPSLANK
ncbi:MAG TPA: hypothetical protein VK395_17765, partial [Gemmataceae bacterium]|nr:hypothetical protein [Gemmataceae bacterium]